jgi:hypothetical protein
MAQSDYSVAFVNASSTCVDCGTVATMSGPAAMTVSAWVKIAASTPGMIASKGTNSSNGKGWFFIVGGSGQLVFYALQSGSIYKGRIGTNGKVGDGTWHHVAATFDGTTIHLFVDGVADDATLDNAGSFSDYTSTQHLFIGRNGDGTPSYFFEGKIDDVSVYTSVLSGGNISGLANATVNPASLSPTGLWRLEDGTGTSANDSSQNGNPGTLTNGPTWSTDVPTALSSAGVNLGDAPTNSGYQSATNNPTATYAWVGDHRLLRINAHLLSVNDTVTAMTYGGAACTKIGVQNVVGGTGRVELWRIHSADAGAPGMGANTISATISGSLSCALTAASYTGVDPTTPTEAFNGNSGIATGTTASVVITTTTDNCWVDAAISSNDSSISAGQTSRNNVTGLAGSGANEDTNGVVHPAGAQTMSYTVSAIKAWAIAGCGIRPVQAAAPSVVSGWQAVFPDKKDDRMIPVPLPC